jgi:hypothetical protein
MDPYVLALQLYLFNKACGGLPLRVAEQIVVSGVVNATCWTARTIGSGVWWLVSPGKKQELGPQPNISTDSQLELENDITHGFEMITHEDITKLETTNISPKK